MRERTINCDLEGAACAVLRALAGEPLPLACAVDMAAIRDQYQRSNGGPWFAADTMRFFGTRLAQTAYVGPGGVYFTTSEQPPHGDRAYSVRRFNPFTGQIDTVGDFCGIAHRNDPRTIEAVRPQHRPGGVRHPPARRWGSRRDRLGRGSP